MTSCLRNDARLDAFVDGELPAPEQESAAAHVASCARCAARVQERRAIAEALRACARRPSAALVDRVESRLRFGPRRPSRLALAAIAAGIAVFGIVRATMLHEQSKISAAAFRTLARIAIDEHTSPFRAGLELPSTVRERLSFALDLPVESERVRAEGARSLRIGGEDVLLASYALDEKPVTLLVTALDPGARDAGGETFRDLRFHLESDRGAHSISWRDGGLTYVLVSNSGREGREACSLCHTRDEVREFWE